MYNIALLLELPPLAQEYYKLHKIEIYKSFMWFIWSASVFIIYWWLTTLAFEVCILCYRPYRQLFTVNL